MSIAEETQGTPSPTNVDELANLPLDLKSVAVQRLIEEVRASDSVTVSANYNRTYNRHNR